MTPPRSGLAASDFSTQARHALERAARLADAHPGAQLTLTHGVSASMLFRLHGMLRDEAPAMEARGAEQAAQASVTKHVLVYSSSDILIVSNAT